MTERKHRHGKLYLLLMALAAAGAAIWVGSSVLSVEEFAFTGARLPAGWDGGRLVLLSDLHGKRLERHGIPPAAAGGTGGDRPGLLRHRQP